MKSWRNEVIENENTTEQKINILLSQNHRSQVLRVKAFRGWKNILYRTRSLALTTEIFKVNIFLIYLNVINKYSITLETMCTNVGVMLRNILYIKQQDSKKINKDLKFYVASKPFIDPHYKPNSLSTSLSEHFSLNGSLIII